jgi:hypothetical protein
MYVQCWKQTKSNLACDRTEEHSLHAVLQGRSAQTRPTSYSPRGLVEFELFLDSSSASL